MAEVQIHPNAIVEDGAILGEGTEVGPFCHIGPEVKLGKNCKLISHVSITGNTTIGDGGVFCPTSVIGGLPQNNAHKGGPAAIAIGQNCTFREGVTVNLGTDTDRALTSIGDNCMFLANSHVAHDCDLGNNITFANGVLLGGHVTIGNNVILGGGVGVHQFSRIGDYAFGGGLAGVWADLIPYGMVVGSRAALSGLNLIGMKRSGMTREEISSTRSAYKRLFDPSNGPMKQTAALMAEEDLNPAVQKIVDFITYDSRRSFITPNLRNNRQGA